MSKLRTMRRRQGLAPARTSSTMATATRVDLAGSRRADRTWDETDVERDAAPLVRELSEFEPVARQYYTVLVYMDLVGGSIRAMPESHLLDAKIAQAQRDYNASGGPDDRYFYAWKLLGARHPLTEETLGDVFAEVFASQPDAANLLPIPALTTALNDSHLALIQHAGNEQQIVTVRDVVTGNITRCLQHEPVGTRGDLFLAWLVPPPPGETYGMSLSDWYPVVEDHETWCAYFERALASIDAPDRAIAYRTLMQEGLEPHGDRYWLDYLYRSSAASERGKTRFCLGLPPT